MSGQQHAPAILYPRKKPGTHCTEGWVRPRARLDRRNISPPPGSGPHRHLANMELRHLLTLSGLIQLEVCLMFSSDFFGLSVCSYLVLPVIHYGNSVCLLQLISPEDGLVMQDCLG